MEIIKCIRAPTFLYWKKKILKFVFIPKTLPVNEHGLTQKITL